VHVFGCGDDFPLSLWADDNLEAFAAGMAWISASHGKCSRVREFQAATESGASDHEHLMMFRNSRTCSPQITTM
jgi:hypothetical protein